MENEQSNVPVEKKLSKKQLKKQAKREKKLADKEFERNAGMKEIKLTALLTGIIGFVIGFVPVAVMIAILIFMILCYLATAVLAIFAVFGLLLFGLGYIIYMSMTENPSLDGYFSVVTGPADFANHIWESAANISGIFVTVCAGVSLLLEIISFILVMITLKAFTKGHRARNIILISLAIVISIILLIVGIAHI